MKKYISLFLAVWMLFSLCACGDSDNEVLFTEVPSVSEVNTHLGYKMLELESKADAITWSSASYRSASSTDSNDAIGQLTYVSGKSTIDLRMTMDEARGKGLSGYQNAGLAGSVQAPGDVFSPLDIYVIHSDLFFSEFSFTNGGYTCYLSLSKSKTDLDSYSALLIDFVNQLYNMKEVPDFAMQEQHKADAEAAKQAAEEAQKAAEEEAQQQYSDLPPVEPVIPDPPKPEKDEEKTDKKDNGKDAKEPSKPAEEEKPAGTITLQYYDMTFKVGEGYKLTPSGGDGKYTWTMADTSIATVSEDGAIVAVAAGETTLTCTSGDGLSAEVIIRVN